MPEQCGTITVKPAFADSEVGIPQGGCTVTTSGPYNPGDSITVNVDIQNGNPRPAEVRVAVSVGGTRIGTQTLTVTDSARATVTGSAPSTTGDQSVVSEIVSVREVGGGVTQSLDGVDETRRVAGAGGSIY